MAEYGYFPNASKSHLIVKAEKFDQAFHTFKDSGIILTVEGQKYLGSSLGTNDYKDQLARSRVELWCEQLGKLSQFAETEPHAAYTALTFGLKHRWTYVMRTTPGIRDLLRPLEDLIANRFIPALIGRKVSRRTRNLMALPARLGGMGIVNPTEISDDELNNSVTLTNSLVNDIVMQSSSHSATEESTRTTLKNISQLRAEKLEARLESIRDEVRHDSS